MKIMNLLGAGLLACLLVLGGASATFAIEPNLLAVGAPSRWIR